MVARRAAASARRCRASSPSPATPCWSRTTPRFDVGHLDAARRALDRAARSTCRALCTLRLARRLHAGARAQGARPRRGALGIAVLRPPPGARRRAHRGRDAVRLPRARRASAASRAWAICWRFQRRRRDGRPLRGPRPARAARRRAGGAGRLSPARRGRPAALRRPGAAAARAPRPASSPTRAATRGAPLELIRQVHDVQRRRDRLRARRGAARDAPDPRAASRPTTGSAASCRGSRFLQLNPRDTFPRLAVDAPARHRSRALRRAVRQRRRGRGRAGVLARVFGLRTCSGRLEPAPDVSPCLLGQVGTCPAPCAARIDAAAYGRLVETFLRLRRGSRRCAARRS